MSSISTPPTRSYHPFAQKFLLEALRYIQEQLGRDRGSEKSGHISGHELLEGIRQLGIQRYGMLCPTVFRKWNVLSTADFGHIVFRMIEEGEMRKTPDDSLDDFQDVYDFNRVFIEDYHPDITAVA